VTDRYPAETTVPDRIAPVAQILSDALIGLPASVTVTMLSGSGGSDVSALIHSGDGRAFTITVRRSYEHDQH
jgi:hypothetical protein